ncbi:acyl-CoA dehydrogenase family protein [Conexibacter sp. JD483]|uniref:acyl-CoA dehydrogenase family protein n=1 Tax=unclassified Conexibacter TaxID=2627773 RepID=UPI0027180737|nr:MULTISPECIES: acyl-CoA dehydrogenase family protein [unclassified Conexibacter]MDO8186739.1 acyl-CoA dehydrogenase family protein [Conexibacter sp. CPCC 205706]MDO8199025.1 acyl-CoA dehydrogenase family protein [Conexibacter sp. CPCC 205762]MDR9368477.1 acyl-CoA dehydrogenase family protein [Conexibacter sp. JD483]
MSLHELTDEQRSIRELARRFAEEEIAPHAAAWDRGHVFPRELFAQLGELGLMGACIPEVNGGAGADFLSYVLALEELARADGGVAVTVAVHVSAATLPLLAFGSAEQIDRWVPPLAQGHELGAFALTEAEAGSDAGALRTRAAADGDAHAGRALISGSKQFITTGSHAHLLIVFARDDAADGAISAFVVKRPAAGLAVAREEEKLGLNSSSTAALSFDQTPGELLGARGAGMRIALGTLDGGRIGIAAQAVGIAQAALDVATAYARERTAFGGPIGRFGQVQAKLAEMQTEIEAARALTWRAARLKQAGLPHTVEGAQAKLLASRVAREWTGEAIQILGGYGYTREFPAERYYRDAKVTEIYEGTSEIQRLVIARALLGDAARHAV